LAHAGLESRRPQVPLEHTFPEQDQCSPGKLDRREVFSHRSQLRISGIVEFRTFSGDLTSRLTVAAE
jgi:hypothetical protein